MLSQLVYIAVLYCTVLYSAMRARHRQHPIFKDLVLDEPATHKAGTDMSLRLLSPQPHSNLLRSASVDSASGQARQLPPAPLFTGWSYTAAKLQISATSRLHTIGHSCMLSPALQPADHQQASSPWPAAGQNGMDLYHGQAALLLVLEVSCDDAMFLCRRHPMRVVSNQPSHQYDANSMVRISC